MPPRCRSMRRSTASRWCSVTGWGWSCGNVLWTDLKFRGSVSITDPLRVTAPYLTWQERSNISLIKLPTLTLISSGSGLWASSQSSFPSFCLSMSSKWRMTRVSLSEARTVSQLSVCRGSQGRWWAGLTRDIQSETSTGTATSPAPTRRSWQMSSRKEIFTSGSQLSWLAGSC